MNVEKCIAGIFAGSGSMLLIYLGHTDIGALILSTMLAFFVGEVNGSKAKTVSEG